MPSLYESFVVAAECYRCADDDERGYREAQQGAIAALH